MEAHVNRIAFRWQHLNAEITGHEAVLARLTAGVGPQLVEAFGVGPDAAAEVLIVAGDTGAYSSVPG